VYRTAAAAGEPGSEPYHSSEPSPHASDLDLADRLRVFQRTLRGRVGRRDTFLDIVRLVNATLEPTRIAELVVEQAATWVPAPCWALVCTDGSGQPSVLAERGLETEMGLAVFDIAGWVMQNGEEFVTAGLQQDPRVHGGSIATVVAFPLTCRGRRIGALIGFDRAPSTREPRLSAVVRRSLRVLLEPVAVALDNAVLLKRAEALSVTDDLTSLYNSRYLNQVLRRESKRASRHGRPLSLLFIDLDGFKAVNDAHGHLCGSRTLVEAAAVIRASARETDVVARFGGDEFALILPDTGAEGAFAVGERIRERLAAHHFLADDGLNIHLTASVGVATLPDAANSSEDLMHAADAAMYQVKDRGKNGIRAAASSR
jgi:diguanylate cyclase (GGDEF)-like protein